LFLFQEQVDHQQATEQMTSVAIDEAADDWGQTETSQTDWGQQSESQTDWSQETETQGDWNSSPANQNDCKSNDIVCQIFLWQYSEAAAKVFCGSWWILTLTERNVTLISVTL
jgi:hypothetical protein